VKKQNSPANTNSRPKENNNKKKTRTHFTKQNDEQTAMILN
jgi:hypothetical protein